MSDDFTLVPELAEPGPATASAAPVLREILFPTDLSVESDRAFEHARFLAERFGANITLYHAVELARREYSRWVKGNAEEVWNRLGEEARAELARRTEGLGFPFKVVVTVPAAPAAVDVSLLDFMGRKQPDLTVMATRGRKGFSGLFLGSVAAEVIRNAGRPVLVVREPEHGLLLPYRLLLLATDLSPASRRAFGLGALLARELDARVLVVHQGRDGAGLEETVRRFLEPEFVGLPLEVKVVEGGAASEAIVREARAVRADLVVMSTRGRDSVSDHLVGSNAERVVRQAPCPVLVT
ncbi:MAG TPA: universal stress protein [Vicinamibacteria bacterium]|nr:universal stress protein [Vicinamibacteria bacterium]